MNDLSIYSNLGCAVLAKNMKIAGDFNTENFQHYVERLKISQTDNILDILEGSSQDEINMFMSNMAELPFYDETYNGLSERYQFPSDDPPACKALLNMAGSLTRNSWTYIGIKL